MAKKNNFLTFICEVQPEFLSGSLDVLEQGLKSLKKEYSKDYSYLELNFYRGPQVFKLYGEKRNVLSKK